MNVVLSARARKDFNDILLSTSQRWGTEQRARYRKRLTAAFRLLGNNPYLGVTAFEFNDSIRCHLVDHHQVYYRINDSELEILRILHERADASRHLS